MTLRTSWMLCACLWLAGCAGPQLSHYQLSALNRGMQPAEVFAKTQVPYRLRMPVQLDGRAFEIERYRLYNGMGSDAYYLAYEDGRLTYWGYLSEFRRHRDAVLVRAVDQVAAAPDPVPAR